MERLPGTNGNEPGGEQIAQLYAAHVKSVGGKCKEVACAIPSRIPRGGGFRLRVGGIRLSASPPPKMSTHLIV